MISFRFMGRFIFDLPDDLATSIEAYRVKRGHKATAVAVRELITQGLALAAGAPKWGSAAFTIQIPGAAVIPSSIADPGTIEGAELSPAVAKSALGFGPKRPEYGARLKKPKGGK